MSDGLRGRLPDARGAAEVMSALDRVIASLIGDSRTYSKLHWQASSWYYRANCANDIRGFDVPPDPFKLEWVDPNSIRRNTRRRYPAWLKRQDDFGAVQGGAWDRRDRPEVDPDYLGTPLHLYIADRFEESTLHRSLEAHFERGVAWEETEFVIEVSQLLETGERRSVWNGCQSSQAVRDQCRSLDELYETIQESGFKSQRELVTTDPNGTFRDWIREEVLVDVGRDGELLLVNGRHRLSLAKLLGVDRIPVLFVVRHPTWMARREAAADSGEFEEHPDLRDLR